MDFKIALTGNPNVGKTSLYNRLTRSFEHVGNWHGVTVKKVSKKISFGGKNVIIDDLPGLYSLSVCSYEESVARDSILNGGYDVIINICEVNNISRNLYLTMQLLEQGLPVLLVVNMIDELKNRGKALDAARLETALGIPVLPLSVKYKIDTTKLLGMCESYAANFKGNKIKLSYLNKLPIQKIVEIASSNITEVGFKPSYAAIKLLENDSFVRNKLKLSQAQDMAIGASKDSQAEVASLRYQFIDSVTDGVIINAKNSLVGQAGKTKYGINTKEKNKSDENAGIVKDKKAASYSELYRKNAGKIDKIILNKYLALPIFFGVMILIFAATFGLLGKYMSDGLEWLINQCLYEPITGLLSKAGAWQWLIDLVGEGIIQGVGGILVFLPQIVLLFFFLALLEDSGYISRVAFMTDGLFRKIGLSGRSVFTMLMGFGCSATAVLTSRGLEDENMRKKTILITPFMSCSARLPVYAAIGGAFFLGANPLIIFALYFLGALVAFILAAMLEKIKKFKSGKLSFIMEMPPYRLPTFERVFQIIWNNSKVFIVRVGTVIFSLNVIVWLLANFSVMGYTRGTEYASFLESISSFIAPVFSLLGFGNWEAVSALMSGFVAKESILATIESLGGISVIFSGGHTKLTVLCFLVFTLLYVPCIATLSAIGKEIGFKWAFISFVLQISVAYLVALIVRGIGLLFIYNTPLATTILVGCIILATVAAAITYSLKNKTCRGCSGCSAEIESCNKKQK